MVWAECLRLLRWLVHSFLTSLSCVLLRFLGPRPFIFRAHALSKGNRTIWAECWRLLRWLFGSFLISLTSVFLRSLGPHPFIFRVHTLRKNHEVGARNRLERVVGLAAPKGSLTVALGSNRLPPIEAEVAAVTAGCQKELSQPRATWHNICSRSTLETAIGGRTLHHVQCLRAAREAAPTIVFLLLRKATMAHASARGGHALTLKGRSRMPKGPQHLKRPGAAPSMPRCLEPDFKAPSAPIIAELSTNSRTGHGPDVAALLEHSSRTHNGKGISSPTLQTITIHGLTHKPNDDNGLLPSTERLRPSQ